MKEAVLVEADWVLGVRENEVGRYRDVMTQGGRIKEGVLYIHNILE